MVLFEFDGKQYYINFNKLFEMVGKVSSHEKMNNTSITQTYAAGVDYSDDDKDSQDKIVVGNDGIQLVTKTVEEDKSSFNEVVSNFKYDFLKNLLNILILPTVDEQGLTKYITSLSELTFGQTLSFNTLLYSGIIVEIENE